MFEDDNKVCVSIYQINKNNNNIDVKRPGNCKYIEKAYINLLLIENEDEMQAHYIYIKKLESFIHLKTTTYYSNRSYCPYCNGNISLKEETFIEHIKKKHYDTQNNVKIELPEAGSSMYFRNYKKKTRWKDLLLCMLILKALYYQQDYRRRCTNMFQILQFVILSALLIIKDIS